MMMRAFLISMTAVTVLSLVGLVLIVINIDPYLAPILLQVLSFVSLTLFIFGLVSLVFALINKGKFSVVEATRIGALSAIAVVSLALESHANLPFYYPIGTIALIIAFEILIRYHRQRKRIHDFS